MSKCLLCGKESTGTLCENPEGNSCYDDYLDNGFVDYPLEEWIKLKKQEVNGDSYANRSVDCT